MNETMATSVTPAIYDSLARLRSFARRPHGVRLRCELCGAPLATEHEHAVESATGRMVCCCGACALLFRNRATARLRTVPRDIEFLQDFNMTDAQWENLSIPIGLAFLFKSTRIGSVVAVYPSPAGGTESQPMPDAWDAIAEHNPVLRDLLRDVEALLVYRIAGAREHYRVPIDECYKLVGVVRSRWRGFTGGIALWNDITRFFESLRARSNQ
jgi:hypothetical protein